MKELLNLAQNIKQIRKMIGMSQSVFACGCGVSVEILSRIERCMTNPTVETLKKIADFCELEIEDLFKPDAHLKIDAEKICKKELVEL